MTWDQVCANRYLKDLPFRIETNRWGQIVMSPPHNDHSFAQSSIYDLLRKKMKGGRVLQETVVDTEDGNKVADATWMSPAFIKVNKGRSSFKRAPEICVEVKSPGNSMGELMEKKDLHLKAGAREVWIRRQSGKMLFFNANGPLAKSTLCPTFPLTVEI
jgi:Uma2 family endonuclease